MQILAWSKLLINSCICTVAFHLVKLWLLCLWSKSCKSQFPPLSTQNASCFCKHETHTNVFSCVTAKPLFPLQFCKLLVYRNKIHLDRFALFEGVFEIWVFIFFTFQFTSSKQVNGNMACDSSVCKLSCSSLSSEQLYFKQCVAYIHVHVSRVVFLN